MLFTGVGLSLIVTAIAGSAPRGVLGEMDFLLHAWPSPYVGLGGTMVLIWAGTLGAKIELTSYSTLGRVLDNNQHMRTMRPQQPLWRHIQCDATTQPATNERRSSASGSYISCLDGAPKN